MHTMETETDAHSSPTGATARRQPESPVPNAIANRCNLAPWELASLDFQDKPSHLEIIGARQADSRLFNLLDRIDDPSDRGATFHEYLAVRFQIEQWSGAASTAPETLRHSYLRFLRGWGADSNRQSGAVLKHWVESRFGLRPTYHNGILRQDSAAQEQYLRDRMRGESETTGIEMQLDLLYTFCQYELARRHPEKQWLTLFRGTHDPEEYAVRAAGEEKTTVVELNNLSSFSSDREIAWEFGSSVWETKVPLSKILFFSGLLPRHLLEGEKEHLVLGGMYRVRKLKF